MMVFQTTKQKLSKKILIVLSVVTLSHFIVVFHSRCLFYVTISLNTEKARETTGGVTT